MDELTRTQPHSVPAPARAPDDLPRRTRLLRTIVFGLAIAMGLATWVIVGNEGEDAPPNASLISSPTGHEPDRRNDDPNVSISWSAVPGAQGYWWALLEDPFRLPAPVIRPSGQDRRVYFRFQGRAYFVLRTAHRIGGRLRWSEEKLYGPIVVGPQPAVSGPGASPGASDAVAGAADDPDALGEPGGPGGSTRARSAPTASPDPRLAGQPGTCSEGGVNCGGSGQPGQPAQQPGGGNGGGGRPSSDEGTPGRPGPSGAPG